MHLNLAVFRAGCKKDMVARAALRRVNELTSTAAVRARLLKEFGPDPEDRLEDNREIVARLCLFGNGKGAQHIGMEPLAVASLRAYTEGEVHFGLCEYSRLNDYVRRALVSADPSAALAEHLPVGKLRAFLSEGLDSEAWPEFVQKVNFTAAHVVAPALLHVPPGSIVVERSLNADSYGIQVSFMHKDSDADSFVKLVGLSDGLAAAGAGAKHLEAMRAIRDTVSKKGDVDDGDKADKPGDGGKASEPDDGDKADKPGDGGKAGEPDDGGNARESDSLAKRRRVATGS